MRSLLIVTFLLPATLALGAQGVPGTGAPPSSPRLTVQPAPPPSEAEAKLLDLIRWDQSGTGPIRKAAEPLAAKGSVYGKFGLGWASKAPGVHFKANRVGALAGIPLAMAYYASGLAASPVSPDDRVEARRWLDLAIERGEPHARFLLGKLLLQGKLGPVDLPEAERCFAELVREEPAYCERVGEFFWHEIRQEIPQEEASRKGLAYLQRAADLGYGSAMWILGRSYGFVGFHTPRDPFKAEQWFQLGEAHGHAECSRSLGLLYLTTGEARLRDPQKAADCLRRAVDRGDLIAMEPLVNLYLDGKELPRDLPKVLALDRKAAAQGWISSMKRLGQRHEAGLEVPRDLPEAGFWYLCAARLMGGDDAELNLLRDRVKAKLPAADWAKVEARAARTTFPDEE